MKNIMIVLLLIFAFSANVMAHDGNESDHYNFVAYIPETNSIFIINAVDNLYDHNYELFMNNDFSEILKVLQDGKEVSLEETGIQFILNHEVYGKVIIFGDHGEFIQIQE